MDILRGNEPTLKITKDALETPWANVLLAASKQKSDISLLYKITEVQIVELKKEGICKIQDMATCDIDSLPKIKGASITTLKRLQQQAKALINKEIIPISKPDIIDTQTRIYFDIEGDSLLGVGYLFGLLIAKENHEPEFKYFIAEKPEDEEKMWVEFLGWLDELNLENYKIYHYGIYEKTQLKKLSDKYMNSDQLSHFIKNLVDLSKTLTDSFIFPIYFYSIKDIAKHIGFKWRHEKAGGGQSIFWYEKWLETNDKSTLQDIINYNEDDVRATEFLHRWLIENK